MTRIAIDWGSTSFRAYRFDDHGALQDTLALPAGIKTAQNLEAAERSAWFEKTLLDAVGQWLGSGESLLLSGMITSRNGWHESPYLDCPVTLSALLPQAFEVDCRSHRLKFLPGVALRDQGADVMRGEELQLIGLTGVEPAMYVMPGTHCKWVLANRDTLFSFRTFPTGELFDVLLKHTLIGGLAAQEGSDHTAEAAGSSVFADAVQKGYREKGFMASLFFARAGVLLEKLQPDEVRAYLSGLLIGREIGEAMAVLFDAVSDSALATRHADPKGALTLVGDSALCALYQQALEVLGIESCYEERDTTVMSFQTLLFDTD